MQIALGAAEHPLVAEHCELIKALGGFTSEKFNSEVRDLFDAQKHDGWQIGMERSGDHRSILTCSKVYGDLEVIYTRVNPAVQWFGDLRTNAGCRYSMPIFGPDAVQVNVARVHVAMSYEMPKYALRRAEPPEASEEPAAWEGPAAPLPNPLALPAELAYQEPMPRVPGFGRKKVLLLDGDETLWTTISMQDAYRHADDVSRKVASGEALVVDGWVVLIRPDARRMLHHLRGKEKRLYSYNRWGRPYIERVAQHLTTLTGSPFNDIIALDRCRSTPPAGKCVSEALLPDSHESAESMEGAFILVDDNYWSTFFPSSQMKVVPPYTGVYPTDASRRTRIPVPVLLPSAVIPHVPSKAEASDNALSGLAQVLAPLLRDA